MRRLVVVDLVVCTLVDVLARAPAPPAGRALVGAAGTTGLAAADDETGTAGAGFAADDETGTAGAGFATTTAADDELATVATDDAAAAAAADVAAALVLAATAAPT